MEVFDLHPLGLKLKRDVLKPWALPMKTNTAALALLAMCLLSCKPPSNQIALDREIATKETATRVDEFVKQISSWYNSKNFDFGPNKVDPAEFAQLTEVKVAGTEGDETYLTAHCDLIFRVKKEYKAGFRQTPFPLQVTHLGFENSDGKPDEPMMLKANFCFTILQGKWSLIGLEQYRPIIPEDHLKFSSKISNVTMGIGPEVGVFRASNGDVDLLQVEDKNGKPINIELVSQKLSKGEITTKQFGKIALGDGPVELCQFHMTEWQIKQLKKYLGW